MNDGIVLRMEWTDGPRKFTVELNVPEGIGDNALLAMVGKIDKLVDAIDNSKLANLFKRPNQV